MAYPDLIQKLFNVNLFGGMKLGLKNMQRLQTLCGSPDCTFQSIHVAGTNGKGSVSIKIAKAFQEAGYRVGLYTSPHISSFRERIRINGLMISEHEVETFLCFLFQLIESEEIPATFFEITTMLAFLYFAKEKVDVAILETGLGGRLDATNIVHPRLSIITSISLDHTDILGNTIEEIAIEKGGIIKEKVPVIIGPHVPLKPIETIACQKQSPLLQVFSSSLLFEEENCQIARTALHYLAPSFDLSFQAIEKGVKEKQPCRFEIISGTPPIILDVAHNPNGLQYLFRMVVHTYPHHQIRLLFGLSKNKDLEKCLQLIATYGTDFHLVEANNGRGALKGDLYAYLRELKVDSSHLFSHDSIFKGVCQAKEEALKQQQILIICGSFFIMKEAREALGFKEPHDKTDLNERMAAIKMHENFLENDLAQ